MHSYQNKTWNCSGQEITVCTHWPRSGMVLVWRNSTSSHDNVRKFPKLSEAWVPQQENMFWSTRCFEVLLGIQNILGPLNLIIYCCCYYTVMVRSDYFYLFGTFSISFSFNINFYVYSQETIRPLLLFSNSLINYCNFNKKLCNQFIHSNWG